MNKAELRTLYLQKRKSLSEPDYQRMNLLLSHHFFTSVDLSLTKVIHVFLPITANREPDTWPIIDRLRREFAHIRLSVPRVNRQTDQLENFFFEGLHQLKLNNWGINEPKQGIPTDPQKIDLVLVPLLAFDQAGHRVGYGKGYYDRFLNTCRNDCRKIGLSLFPPIEKIGAEPQDVRLNFCITPEKVYSF